VLRLFWSIAGGIFLTISGQAAPQRVVSLAPNLTSTVISLGGANHLLAVTPFCDAPESIQRLPGGIQPESETLLALKPDLVLATSMTPATTRRQLQDLGLQVEVIDVHSLDDIKRATNRVAELLQLKDAPPPSLEKTVPTRSVALLFGADTGYSAGCGTHAHEILEAAGLHNIAADVSGPWPQLGDEFLLSQDPELIIVADYGASSPQEILQNLRRHPVRRHLSAVRNERILVFPAQAFSIPGPAALEAPAKLRASLPAQ
jgi:iron complex transport system substrate-binding protein